MMSYRSRAKGFTLIEVLIALVIIAISLTALLRATGQNIRYTNRLQEKTIKHWVAWQGINMVQSGNVIPKANTTMKTHMFHHDWYWRLRIKSMPLPKIKKITVFVSTKETGPFEEILTGYQLLQS